VQPKIYHTTDHDIDPAFLDIDAVHVVKRLREAGFTAYLVGGSVRDLLVKKTPKDYDISTSAHPEQIKKIFQRQCLLIGRRFRLAHIRFGHKIIEVATFRAGDNDSDLIVQDNIWGTPEEDVLRRDFTINGLFYDPSNHTVIDYVGGWEDIHTQTLRTIGEATTRFKQDPVRMIRLLKFQSRFGFNIDPAATQALKKCHPEILKSSSARILEELLRMLESGASATFFRLMTESGLLELLFPALTAFLKGNDAQKVYQLLAMADQINLKNKKTLDRSILAACLLYPTFENELDHKFHKHNINPHFGDILLLSSSVIKEMLMSSFAHFPKRINMLLGFILSTQYRMTPKSGKRHQRPKLLQSHEFEFALRFLKIRAMADELLIPDYNWWMNCYRQAGRQSERRGHHPHPSPDHHR